MNKDNSPEAPATTQSHTALDFGFAYHLKDNDELFVEFHPIQPGARLSPPDFARLTHEAGYPPEDFPLIPANVSVLLDAMKRGEPYEICISKPEDARIDLFTSPDKLLAGAVLHGARGRGRTLDRDLLDQALRKTKIVRGLLDEAVNTLLSPELAARLHNTDQLYCTVIAYGEHPREGQDARLEPLIKDASDRRPMEDEYGRVDFLEKGDFPFIEENTPLMRRHPSSKGKPGWTVLGKTLRAKDGKDIQFKLKDDSVRPDEQDENLLRAAISGIPVILEKGAQVEQLLKVNKVDLETGHVRYRGSIEVKGDVRDGMQVVATGDVKVHGGVDAAFIQAGGHIEIIGGAIGHKDAQHLNEKSALKAGCSIKARFVHEAILEAGQEIIIGNQVMHSNLKSGSFIQVQGKGQVVGGRTEAVDYIEINASGAVAYSETELIVGECDDLQKQYTQLLHVADLLEKKKYELVELARKTRQQGRQKLLEMKDRLIAAKEKIQARQKELNQALTQTESQLRRYYAAKIIVHRRAYPGTLITLAGKKHDVNRELDKVTFFLQDDQVQTRQ